jgi:hypothetical protein
MTTTAITPEQDIARWVPSDASVKVARAMLEAEPRADMAVIPMAQPGKEHSWWTVGQEVQTVPGVAVLATNGWDVTDPSGEVPAYSWARAEAVSLAERWLNGRAGTVAYAVVMRDMPEGMRVPVHEW